MLHFATVTESSMHRAIKLYCTHRIFTNMGLMHLKPTCGWPWQSIMHLGIQGGIGYIIGDIPVSKVHGANMGADLGPTRPMWAPCGPRGPCYLGSHGSRFVMSLQWCHNWRDGVSKHQPHDCLLNRLFWRRSKKTSKLRVTGLCEGNSPDAGELPAQRASNAENVSIWWRHHVYWSLIPIHCIHTLQY